MYDYQKSPIKESWSYWNAKWLFNYRVSENIFETSFPNSPKKRNLITAIPLSFLFWNTWTECDLECEKSHCIQWYTSMVGLLDEGCYVMISMQLSKHTYFL